MGDRVASMRVVIIGGTEFIGRRVVEMLAARGDEVMVVHRGRTEPADLPDCTHVHVDRRDFVDAADIVREFRPDAVVDCIALTAGDVAAVLPHLPAVPVVALSSMDVYRAFELLTSADDPERFTPLGLPVDEDSAVRVGRYPYRGKSVRSEDMDAENYEKLDVEPAYLARGGTVLRLGMVYGPRDPQRREEFLLRRLRAGEKRIAIGPATTVLTRLHVDDAASAVLAALDDPEAAAGQVFNIGETRSYSMRGWIELILAAAAERAVELVTVSEDQLPADMGLTRVHPQHLIVSSAKANRLLGWQPMDTAVAVAESVRWHLANPPAGPS
jgi:nucleoside-diphosphate-sugar epimerase